MHSHSPRAPRTIAARIRNPGAEPMSRPWYEAAFGADYLERYAHRSEDEADRAVAIFLEHAPLPDGAAVMDLCCGAGRHVKALRARGFHAVGLDLSVDLLVSAAERIATPEGRPPAFLVRADKRRHPFADATFDAVTHFFTAFGYFADDAENFAVFDEVARVLRPGGWYLFDFLSAPSVRAEFADRREIVREESDEGVDVRTTRRLSGDGLRVEKHMEFFRAGECYRELRESVRAFMPEELRPALAAARLGIAEEWGGYDAKPWRAENSKRWIALCRKSVPRA